ncbi:MAG TPA: 3-hydroxyisobutyryl-CoA hydrolase [Pseudonocardia sp.]|jgi:enoyl-CoA hydratase|nr:3-hydroxyisobutyryl-CoA hydrolase [Pseudonocardia sp.]
MTEDAEPILARRDGRIGRITLNRPRVINALTIATIRALTSTVRNWWDDGSVEVVVLDGAGERGFCAGGDITVVRDSALGDHAAATELWREEYQLDFLLAHFPRPVVAVMDGIVMGGGLGLGGRAALRIVTERSRVAMPEVLIGFSPDVGACDLLARAPGELGTHLALTATTIGAADALHCGLADVFVPSDELAATVASLHHTDPAQIRSLGEPEPGELEQASTWIDECYLGDDPAAIVDRLRTHPCAAARDTAERLGGLSPTSVAVSLRGLREARAQPGLGPCLIRDFRMIRRFLDHPDLVEGITARVIDRSHQPRWSPARLADVDPSSVAAFFAPLGADELTLPDV